MTSSSGSSNKAVGDTLEQTVTLHYEALGFKVTPDVNVRGHQIDLMATRYISGAAQLTVMIEVKSRAGSVGINDVTPFLNTASDLRLAGDIQSAVLVTNGRFSQDARSAVRSRADCRLLTVKELAQDLFNYSEALLKFKHEHEAQSTFSTYVPLEGEMLPSRRQVPDVAEHIQQWLSFDHRLLVVVGDFGSGKSTILERACYGQTLLRLFDPNAKFPIFLRLRGLLAHSDLWSFIANALHESQSITLTRRAFESQLSAGKLALFLDGFDEIHTGATAHEKASYLKRIVPLLSSGSPCVLSTRPTYFDSFDEMKGALAALLAPTASFQRLPPRVADMEQLLARLDMGPAEETLAQHIGNVVQLVPLTDEKITEYLRQFEADLRRTTASELQLIKEFLYRIYDLQDLMRRPLLLQMVVATILAGQVNVKDRERSLGPSTLYELYTQLCAKRDVKKDSPHQFLAEGDRLLACRAIALRMFCKGSLQLSHDEIKSAVGSSGLAAFVGTKRHVRADLERAVTDIRLCTFLSFGTDDAVRFAHPSYIEFFVAQAIVERSLREGVLGWDVVAATRIPREVVYFLGSFARDLPDFGRLIAQTLEASELTAVTLCARVAFAAGSLLRKVVMNGITLEEVDLRRSAIDSVVLRNCLLKDISISDSSLTRWQIVEGTLDRVELRNVEIARGDLRIRCIDTHFDTLSVSHTDLGISGDRWTMSGAFFEHCNVDLVGQGTITGGWFAGGRVRLGPGLLLTGSSTPVLRNCPVIGTDGGRWYSADCRVVFDDCVLAGVFVEMADIDAMLSPRREGSARNAIDFKLCRGIVLTKLVRPRKAVVRRGLWPNVTVFDVSQVTEALNRERHGKGAAGRSSRAGSRDYLDFTTLLEELRNEIRTHGLENSVDGILAEVMR